MIPEEGLKQEVLSRTHGGRVGGQVEGDEISGVGVDWAREAGSRAEWVVCLESPTSPLQRARPEQPRRLYLRPHGPDAQPLIIQPRRVLLL